MFKTRHILIGNIPVDYVAGGRISEENIAKVPRAVERSFPRAKIKSRSLEPLRSNKKFYLSLRDLGAVGSKNGRVSVVVEIEEMLVGVGLKSGIQLFNRVRVDLGAGEGGEYFTRTLLEGDEARTYLRLIKEPKDVELASFRHPFYSNEMVDLARRVLKNSLKQAIGTPVNIIPVTCRHKFEGSTADKEETILIALTEFPEMNDILADILGFPRDEEGVFFLRIGSMELQGHRSASSIWETNLLKSDHRVNCLTWGEPDNNMDMLEVFNERSDQSDILALIKKYSQRGTPEWMMVKLDPIGADSAVDEKLDRRPEFRKSPDSLISILTWK
jgi:hypothetical protein